jgi:uncharacterized membrane protein
MRRALVLVAVALAALAGIAWLGFDQPGVAGACVALALAALWAGGRSDDPNDGG